MDAMGSYHGLQVCCWIGVYNYRDCRDSQLNRSISITVRSLEHL